MSRAEFATSFPSESPFIEFKAGVGGRPLQEAIVAFSNTDGGVILIGVTDAGEIAGRDANTGTEDAVQQVIREVNDPGRYSIHRLDIDGTVITVLAIARRVAGFAQTSSGRTLVRRGTYKVALIGDELRRFVVARSLQRFEESAAEIPLSEAEPLMLAELASVHGWGEADSHVPQLRERGMVMPDSDQLTIAGSLFLLGDPGTRLGKAYIEVLRYPEGSADYDRRVQVSGPLPQQIRDATSLVADELGRELVVIGLTRYDLPRIPIVVLREAISNAVAHRSYEEAGTAVRVELRPDRVVITSPGSLPEPVTEDNIRDTQAARNLSVISALRRFGLAEDVGRGVDVMEDSMRAELLDPPRFHDTGHTVQVELPIRSAVTASERAWVREVETRGLIEPRDRIVLVRAARGETLTNSKVREILGVGREDARDSLRRLRDAGLLSQQGERGGATYSLAASIEVPAGLRLPRDELAEMLLKLARQQPLTNARVRASTGLDRAEALGLLRDLVSQGRLVQRGERRGTRYELQAATEPGT